MPLFKPNAYFHRITQIPFTFFSSRGLWFVVLDVDNTLTTHDNPVPAAGVADWLEEMQQKGLRFVILSNNQKERVAFFAEKLGLPFVFKGGKPLPFALGRAMQQAGAEKKDTVLIGDQLFTDMLCGNLKGITTLLVEPFEIEGQRFLRFKRWLETPFIKAYQKIKEKEK